VSRGSLSPEIATGNALQRVEHLVASVRPRAVPREGIRKVTGSASPATPAPAPIELTTPAPLAKSCQSDCPGGQPKEEGCGEGVPIERAESMVDAVDERPRRAQVEAVSRDRWSLRVTLDSALRADLRP
jgi:hypothetical protein